MDADKSKLEHGVDSQPDIRVEQSPKGTATNTEDRCSTELSRSQFGGLPRIMSSSRAKGRGKADGHYISPRPIGRGPRRTMNALKI